MKNLDAAIVTGLLAATVTGALAQSPPGALIPVTVDNFSRAESDMYFAMFVGRGGFGKFIHLRELPLEGTGVRPNRDTLYSQAVFDLDAGPVTVTLADAGKRFMSLMVINQDHYALETVYTPNDYTYTRGGVGTRYVFIAARPIRTTSSRCMPCRIRSRSSSPADQAASRYPTGIRPARKRCATRCWCSTIPCRI